MRQDTNQPAPNNGFQASRQFAVAGERFSFHPSDLAAVFPPDLAAGELSGVLPHVMLSRRTLPWERSATGDAGAPWLALLLFDDSQAPAPMAQAVKVPIPTGTAITAAGGAVTGTGTLARRASRRTRASTRSATARRPTTPARPSTSRPRSSARSRLLRADWPFLAHIRETDTADAQDATQATNSLAVVLGNRVPQDGVTAHDMAPGVGGEHGAALFPDADGNPGGRARRSHHRAAADLPLVVVPGHRRGRVIPGAARRRQHGRHRGHHRTTPAWTSATSSADQFTYIPSTPPAPTPAPLAVTGVSRPTGRPRGAPA